VKILDGKKLSERIISELKKQVSGMAKKPILAIISVGDDQSSKVYVRNKKRACKEAGIEVVEADFPENADKQTIIDRINDLNEDENISAIIVQLPLPKQIDRFQIFEAIKPEKDADCLNPLNFGNFFQKGEANFPIGPATPVGIIRLLEEYKISVEKKYAVLIGYSDIVGKPLSEMFLARGATVTICHDKTHNLADFTKKADILVSATGIKHLIKEGMVKEGAVLVDVGISRDGNKISGDIDFENVSEHSSSITPVPGGVGPMTVAILLENVLRLVGHQAKNGAKPKEEPLLEKVSSGISADIRGEFSKYISAVTDQYETMSDLKKDIAKFETELEMFNGGKQNILSDLKSALEEIPKLKANGWISPKEQYVKKIKKITQTLRVRIKKLLSGMNQYDSASQNNHPKISPKLNNFKIPTEYGEYYETCKNYFENELFSNENEIKDLEEKKRQLIISAEKVKLEIKEIDKNIISWEAWLDERVKDMYEELEEFHLAAINFFEHEQDNLLR
jgi:methylenetetrahydrofolate dehydrogenase (NADP+) / methenyltetrahydrofolate cyclohydrolase